MMEKIDGFTEKSRGPRPPALVCTECDGTIVEVFENPLLKFSRDTLGRYQGEITGGVGVCDACQGKLPHPAGATSKDPAKLADCPISLAEATMANYVVDEQNRSAVEAATKWLDSEGRDLFLYGPTGCLHGDTGVVYMRGLRNTGRPLTLKQLYQKFNGLPTGKGREWDLSMPTFLHSLAEDGTVFYNRVVAVYESGVKPLVRLTVGQRELRSTADHPVMTPSGFVPASELKEGQSVLVRAETPTTGGGRDLSARPPRVIVNTKWHPFGSYKCVEGQYEYMRVARARLVVEADLNDIPYDEFVHALKHNQALSATFRYIPTDFEVHHEDENTLNDSIGNLAVMTKAAHARLHGNIADFRRGRYEEATVSKIEDIEADMTYDVQMESPANNFCANEIIVHNTGKTRLAISLARMCDVSSRYARVPALMRQIKDGFAGEGFPIQPFVDVPLLILDDIGAEKPSAFTMQTIETLYTERLDAGRNTIFTSNLPITARRGERTLADQLDDARFLSRLFGSAEQIELKGVDRRLR